MANTACEIASGIKRLNQSHANDQQNPPINVAIINVVDGICISAKTNPANKLAINLF